VRRPIALSAAQRGYGVEYVRARAAAARLVRAGAALCAICGEPIRGAFHLGHSDDRSHLIGPTHPRCNVVEAGLKSARLRRGEQTVTSRQW
jgi:hypothetical protein